MPASKGQAEGGVCYWPSKRFFPAVACPQPWAGTRGEERSDGWAAGGICSLCGVPVAQWLWFIKCSGLTCEPWLLSGRWEACFWISDFVCDLPRSDLISQPWSLDTWNGCVLRCRLPCRTVSRANLVKVLRYPNNIGANCSTLVLQNLPSALLGRHERGEGFI